jgi:hypothetical protein
MDLNRNGFVVASIEGNQDLGREMFGWMTIRWPFIIMGLEMETEVGAKTSRNSSAKVGSGCDPGCTSLQVGTEMLMAGTDSHSQNVIAMEAPKEAVTHICEG